MTKAIYNLCQITYCLTLIDDASKFPKHNAAYLPATTPVSVFMADYYLGSKYQTSFNRMIDGECHRLTWDGPDVNKRDLSDLLACADTCTQEHWGTKDIEQHNQGKLFEDRHYG